MHLFKLGMTALVIHAASVLTTPAFAGTVTGPLTAWQPVTIEYTGPASGEFATPNPFLDYRLQVTFTGPSAQTYSVPGAFVGDGAGNGTGNIWRVRFTPDEPGAWSAVASFREGTNVAVTVLADETPDPTAGTPTAFDGVADSFTIAPPDTAAPGFLAKGRLAYNGTHYLTFADGDAFVKGGVDSPENWLGYYGFDNTSSANNRGPNTPDRLHRFPTHEADWNPGDPDWDSPDTPEPNDGRRIIGALNYLESVGANNIYFLPMNTGGDAQDTWPYADPAIDGSGNPANNNTRFDISKLEQWDIVFDHAQRKGIMLHFVLNEAEGPNKQELDNATLGTERRLFYREMIARFGYHNAIVWNISEEYNLSLNIGSAAVLDWARAIKGQDPYSTPVTVHNAGNPSNPSGGPWGAFVGQPDIDLTSLQWARVADGWGQIVADYRDASAAAGKPIPVMVDEPASPTRDVTDFDEFRKRVIWDVLLSGGGGEWFINNRDQSLEDFREFDKIWVETFYCRNFIENNLPFTEMVPDNSLVSSESATFGGAEVFTKLGEVYAIYYPSAASTGSLDLSAQGGAFTVRWYNPRTGAFVGMPTPITGGGSAAMPSPPSDPGEDWVALVEAGAPTILFVRGADRSGGFLEAGNNAARTEQLSDITNPSTAGGNHGWLELAQALEAEGFELEQILEPLAPSDPPTGPTAGAPVPFDTLDLGQYAAIVLGSNNAAYQPAQIDAIEQYVLAGGAVLFISDANFGGSWNDAPDSDQQFLDRFGWAVQQDQGTYALERSEGDFLVPDHPILAGVSQIDGEGVSPGVIPATDIAGVESTLIVRANPGSQTRNNNGNPGSSRPVGPSDATLMIASAGQGRIAIHFDRNTFFNLNGAGTNINRFDNRTYALNLFNWLAFGGDAPEPPDPADCNANGIADADEINAPGLLGEYFDGIEFAGERRVRIDAVVDFDFGTGAPYPDWDGDTFSCRWTGFVRTTVAGDYQFFTTTNDGARLFVDGVQLVDAWQDQAPTEFGGTITLPADAWIPIRMEHYEGQGTAVAELRWQPPGGVKEIIPAASITPTLDTNGDGTPDECPCPSDLTTDGTANGIPDGVTTLSDFSFYLGLWGASDPAADVTTDGTANGIPDGSVTLSDFSFYLGLWGAGCP